MIRITLDPDPAIEPGHQWLAVENSDEGRALATLLMEPGVRPFRQDGNQNLFIPHDQTVDQNIVALINALAHVRFSAPRMLQLTMMETDSHDSATAA